MNIPSSITFLELKEVNEICQDTET